MSAKTFVCSLVLVLAAGLTSPAANPSLRDVKKIHVKSIGNGIEQQLELEITRQFQGALTVTKDIRDADAILEGQDAVEEKGMGKKITGKFGLNDEKVGNMVLFGRDGKTILWMEQAGDRRLWLGPMSPESKKKIAERLVRKLRKAFKDAH